MYPVLKKWTLSWLRHSVTSSVCSANRKRKITAHSDIVYWLLWQEILPSCLSQACTRRIYRTRTDAGNRMIWGWNKEPDLVSQGLCSYREHGCPGTPVRPSLTACCLEQVVTRALMKLIYLAEGSSLLCLLASQEFMVACDRIICHAPFGFLRLHPKPLWIREKAPSSYSTLQIRVCPTIWHQRQTISALAKNHSSKIHI